jgi:uncharacterized protein
MPALTPAKPAAKHGKRALYQRSCDLGSAIGCNDLAILVGGEDAGRAMTLLERACSLGLARGCANWGVQILRSEPGEKERQRAVELLSAACEQSDGYACAELGDAWYGSFERSGASAYGRAHVAYEKACKLGQVGACASEGWLLRNGEGTSKNAGRARELFRFACEHDSYAGCAALGYDLMDDAKNADEYAEGARWLKVACEHDEAFGCFSMGVAMIASEDAARLDGGLALLKRSCALGSSDGCRLAEAIEARIKNAAVAGSAAHDDDGDEEGDE